MKIINLTKNRFIKIIGIFLVLYFALFYNKENPNSLGNRWSMENLKNNFGEMNEKSRFIITNVGMARQIEKEKAAQANLNHQNHE